MIITDKMRQQNCYYVLKQELINVPAEGDKVLRGHSVMYYHKLLTHKHHT